MSYQILSTSLFWPFELLLQFTFQRLHLLHLSQFKFCNPWACSELLMGLTQAKRMEKLHNKWLSFQCEGRLHPWSKTLVPRHRNGKKYFSKIPLLRTLLKNEHVASNSFEKLSKFQWWKVDTSTSRIISDPDLPPFLGASSGGSFRNQQQLGPSKRQNGKKQKWGYVVRIGKKMPCSNCKDTNTFSKTYWFCSEVHVWKKTFSYSSQLIQENSLASESFRLCIWPWSCRISWSCS